MTVIQKNNASPATFTGFTASLDAIKNSRTRTITNMFFYAPHLEHLITHKKCLQYSSEGCVFLLVPRHDTYYDCLYAAASLSCLEEGLHLLPCEPKCAGKPLRILLMGKEAAIAPLSAPLAACGFEDRGKLVNFDMLRLQENIRNAPRQTVPQAGYASENDAENILTILKTEFDLYSDNIPELETIREDARNRNIAVMRENNKIIAIHYFYISHATYTTQYDWCEKTFRHTGLYRKLVDFMMCRLRDHHPEIQNGKVFRRLADKQSMDFAFKIGERRLDFFMHTWVLWPGSEHSRQRRNAASL